MREKLLTWLGILLIITIFMACIDENAIAKNNHKKPTIRPVPTIIPVPDQDRPDATPTPSPAPVPSATPTPAPVPETTPEPASAPVLPSVPIDVLYQLQPRWPVFNTTPVPTEAPVQNATAVLSTPSDGPTPTPLPSPLETDIKLTRPGMSPGVIISALMGFACVSYLAYLGYVMIRR